MQLWIIVAESCELENVKVLHNKGTPGKIVDQLRHFGDVSLGLVIRHLFDLIVRHGHRFPDPRRLVRLHGHVRLQDPAGQHLDFCLR